ncbi:hypothetical protein ACFOWE_07875 [Planomonospora corallina]|uniref:Fimbrial assembly family protein n=1 Tax=Planomonospora corallina TaxID=1806052 RepID=A0ABV8I203_9ACTN
MTTETFTLPVAEPAPQDPFRMLSVAADLLPPEIVAARRDRRVRSIVLSVLLVFVLLMAGWYGSVRYQTMRMEEDAAAAQADVQILTRQQQEFAELVTTRAQAESIDTQLSVLLADDTHWAGLLASVRRAAPDGVGVASISAKINERAAGGDASADPSRLNTSGEKIAGELSITGTGDGKQSVARYVDALGGVDGLGNALLTDAREQESGVEFAVRVDITDAAFGGRYTTEPGEGN